MKHRQFGAWSARIIGPHAHIAGPRGLRIIADVDRLRRMWPSDADGDAAFSWALGELQPIEWIEEPER